MLGLRVMHLLYLGGSLGGTTVSLYQNGGCNEVSIYAEYNVDVKPFDPAVLQLEQYEYAASGILYPADSKSFLL